jgi:hypothetical protein
MLFRIPGWSSIAPELDPEQGISHGKMLVGKLFNDEVFVKGIEAVFAIRVYRWIFRIY